MEAEIMKRRVIQIANSTQLVSLPRKWAVQNNIKKGDEVDVVVDGNKIVISSDSIQQEETREIDVSNLGSMILRYIVALYKKGIDEIKVVFNKPELISSVQKVIGKEAVGFEITDQGKDYCIIKHVSGELEDFDPVLRRTMLLLLSMADRSYEAIKEGKFEQLQNIAFLEEANNRFTTSCRRFLNKKGYKNPRIVGPLYYIVEDLENLADQYKYLCMHLYKFSGKKQKVNKNVLDIYQRVNQLLKTFYEIFYSFDDKKVAWIGAERKDLVDKIFKIIESNRDPSNFVVLHYLLTIMMKVFCLVGPAMVVAL